MSSTVIEPVDVVVVSYNSSAFLRDCVEEIASREGVEVFVVDNASTDRSVETIQDLGVVIVAEQTNRGFGHGCNLGWRRGKAPYVLFLNPDARLADGAIDALIGALEGADDVGIVGPRISSTDGSLAWSQRRFPRLASTFSQALFLHHVFPTRSWSDEIISDAALYQEGRDVEWLSGACLLVRRSLLEQSGGFDETFFLYSEDTELCRAAWSRGYRVRYEPKARVTHVGGASAPRPRLLAVLARSRVQYARKNYSRKVANAHQVGIALEGLTHAVIAKGGWTARRGSLRACWAAIRTARRRVPDERAGGGAGLRIEGPGT